MDDTERLHIELFSHLTGLAAFHQRALHVLQPGGREGRKRNRGRGQKQKCLKVVEVV